MILPWDFPTVPGISQKIPPHTSKIKQTWLNQKYSITEIWLYFAILPSNGFLFRSTIMALTYYFAQHTSRWFAHTQKLWVEKNWTIKVYQELVLAYPHTHQCISSNAILISFFWNAKISNLTIFITRSSPRISNLIRHAFTKLRNFKGNFIRFKKALGTRKLFGVMEVL